jgi:hypothetical protein
MRRTRPGLKRRSPLICVDGRSSSIERRDGFTSARLCEAVAAIEVRDLPPGARSVRRRIAQVRSKCPVRPPRCAGHPRSPGDLAALLVAQELAAGHSLRFFKHGVCADLYGGSLKVGLVEKAVVQQSRSRYAVRDLGLLQVGKWCAVAPELCARIGSQAETSVHPPRHPRPSVHGLSSRNVSVLGAAAFQHHVPRPEPLAHEHQVPHG